MRVMMAVLLALVAGSAAGQAPGAAISVPLPLDLKQLAEYDVVELSGARAADESDLIDGELPPLVLEYVTRMATIRQRLALYENGLIEIDLEGAGADLRKRVRIPDEAVAAYEAFFRTCELERFDPIDRGDPDRNQVVLRVRQDDRLVERRFPATTVLPEKIERLRQLLNDVLRVICEDRAATNPLAEYKPVIGDVLVADDQRAYRVVRLINDGEYTELLATRDPLRLIVATSDLHLYFVARQNAAAAR